MFDVMATTRDVYDIRETMAATFASVSTIRIYSSYLNKYVYSELCISWAL